MRNKWSTSTKWLADLFFRNLRSPLPTQLSSSTFIFAYPLNHIILYLLKNIIFTKFWPALRKISQFKGPEWGTCRQDLSAKTMGPSMFSSIICFKYGSVYWFQVRYSGGEAEHERQSRTWSQSRRGRGFIVSCSRPLWRNRKPQTANRKTLKINEAKPSQKKSRRYLREPPTYRSKSD